MSDPAAPDTASPTIDRDFDRYVPQRRFQQTVAISPDGAAVAYVNNDGGQHNLWVQPLGDGDARALTSFTEHSVRCVAWSPDGSRLVFAADHQGDEQFQVYLIDASGGEPRRLTHTDDRQFDLQDSPFSRDGRLLVYAGNDRDEMVQDLLIHDLQTDVIRRVESVAGEFASSAHVSPDGQWLLAAVARSNTDADTAVVDLRDAESGIRVLTPHDGEANYLPAGWLADSSAMYLITDADSEFRSLALCRLDGHIDTLVAPDWDVEGFAQTDDGATVVWIVNEAGASVPYACRAEALGSPSSAVRVPVPDGVLGAFDVTPDGSTIVGLWGTGTRPTDLVRIGVTTGAIEHLTDSRPPALLDIEPVDPVAVDYPTHDDRRIPAWLYQPHGEGPHPVVLSIHGGPEAQERAEYMYSGLYQYLLANGIGVLAPNVRGSTGYGVSYQKLIHRDWGGDELGDFGRAVAYLQSLHWVDADRIAVFGGSFGGFATLSCVSRLPDLFAAGVSIVGPSNLVTLTRSVPPTWRPLMASWVGDPDDDHDFLMQRSPITYAEQITAPLMVIQGANDPRVVKAESDQIVEALRARGVEVRYDVYDDEGHGFTKRANEIRAIGDVAEFLVERLRPGAARRSIA
jgi:dipeptidyl aminopeptidase/acylaminoacyl peptidase